MSRFGSLANPSPPGVRGTGLLALSLLTLGFVMFALLVDGSMLRGPGIVLLVGFDVQTVIAPGIMGNAVDVAREIYRYVLAVGLAGLYRWLRGVFSTQLDCRPIPIVTFLKASGFDVVWVRERLLYGLPVTVELATI